MNDSAEILSVTELTRALRRLVEDGLSYVWVEGEVSNYKLHSSGHRYFTLKDVGAQLACVMWRTRAQPEFKLNDGVQVRAYGKVTVWELGGRYQLDVQSLRPAGLGALQAALETLKRKLAAEGLFDASRKKPLPRFPRAIGLATSPTGAAIRDLVWGFSTRWPAADLYLIPVAVQGEGAAAQIAAAIEAFNSLNLVDVIIIGRGGGSLEDLWAFNEEVVVRAVAASRLPVVSAVGHEVDMSLSDLAADLRAPTPTAAAALVVPDREEILTLLQERGRTINQALVRTLTQWRERLTALSRGYGFRRVEGRVGDERLRLEETERRMTLSLARRLELSRQALAGLDARLQALSPENVFDRGWCLAKDESGALIRRAGDLRIGSNVHLRFKEGQAQTVVDRIINS